MSNEGLLLAWRLDGQGGDPEDMVSIRMWIDDYRVISVRLRRLLSVQDLSDSLSAGKGVRKTSASWSPNWPAD